MSNSATTLPIISASSLKGAGAGTEIQFAINFESDELAVPEAHGVISGNARVVRGDGEMVAWGEVNVDITVPCRRCLEPVTERAAVEFEGRYVPYGNPAANPESRVFDPEVFSLDERGAVDLTELLREAVISTVSPIALCMPDCAGLCSVCGNNLNHSACGCTEYDEDPRWAPLRTLMVEMTSQAHFRPQQRGITKLWARNLNRR